MARKTKKTAAPKLPVVPCASVLDTDTRHAIYDAVGSQAGNEAVVERFSDSHIGWLEVELYDGRIFLLTLEVCGQWDDWNLIGAKLIYTPPIEVYDE